LQPLIEERKVTVKMHGSLGRAICDETLITEVFMNLFTNAIKYNDNHQITVEVGVEETIEGSLVYHVRDNGIGIPEMHHEEIFKIFRRLHTRERYGGGTGFGLALVKRIILRHEGSIWVESSPGQGSTFYFTFS